MVAALPHTTAHSEHVQPAFFATTSWIRTQRVAALAIVALGLMASTLAGVYKL